jgi:hypothetical protein
MSIVVKDLFDFVKEKFLFDKKHLRSSCRNFSGKSAGFVRLNSFASATKFGFISLSKRKLSYEYMSSLFFRNTQIIIIIIEK